MYCLEFKLVKQVKVCGNIFLSVSYNLFNIIYWLSIFFLVWFHSGHISTLDNYRSTTSLKIKESVFTNFTREEFRPYLYKPSEFESYNRVWDSDDYSFSHPDEIQVITNLVITPNQTRTTCPETPYVNGNLCDPDNNQCEKGKHTVHGIATGKCVPCNVKYHKNENNPDNRTEIWTDRYCCEIEGGWCPVKYLLVPLKNFTAVLKDSKHSTLWVRNLVTFNEYGITLDNQINEDLEFYLNCRYDPQTDPKCPVFKLGKIVELSKNNRQDFDTMATFGALINMKISYKCFLPLLDQIISLPFISNLPFLSPKTFDQNVDCEWMYEFYRIDKGDHPVVGHPTFRKPFLYDEGNRRTHWQTYRLRIMVEVIPRIGYYNLFKFCTMFFAYHGLYSLLKMILTIYVRKMLATHEERDKIEDKIVFNTMVSFEQNVTQNENQNQNQNLNENQNQNETKEIKETTPLLIKSPINKSESQSSLISNVSK